MKTTRTAITGLAILLLTACGSNAVTPADSTSDPAAAVSEPAGSTGVVRYPVSGRVVGPTGDPVAGVLITAVSLDTPALAVPELAVITDDTGEYRWPGLAPGRYELRAQAAAGQGAVKVTIGSAGSVRGDLTLKKS